MITSRQAKTTGGTVRAAGTLGRAMRATGVAAALLGLATAFACSSSSKSTVTPCNENPWECKSGQVCWPTTMSAFACVASGTGKAGDTCMLTIGTATCSDGLNCLATSATGDGICTPYCQLTGTAHTCPSTSVCEIGELPGGGDTDGFNVCVPLAAGDDSGSDDSGETVSDGGSGVSEASVHEGGSGDAATGASDASSDAPVGE
jgi:hypothetical protein